ncbi:thioredoxin [Desulfofundulus thermobenzoicus]|uniref:Thioredoxin n=1 Tax=Desulfofundulus thermobenzoicus TaxID=29376 RepID=A0A6N7ITZ9_9FIRM|nr:thioredoxin family protein [Desulfofundulus thermobenzoicus]MQL53596.1 thioredoxin [Desulfofundulus thermobenzoicus]HHW44087.1 thioredoxin family protein [Desulfotomaculum sp.]
MPQEVNKDNFETEVESVQGFVLVDFWGPSCQPCLALMPFVEELAEKYSQQLKVVKVDSSKNRRLCINLKVLSLPTFLMYHNGREVGRLSGKEVTREELDKFVQGFLNN